jgi:hypothetical protein
MISFHIHRVWRSCAALLPGVGYQFSASALDLLADKAEIDLLRANFLSSWGGDVVQLLRGSDERSVVAVE